VRDKCLLQALQLVARLIGSWLGEEVKKIYLSPREWLAGREAPAAGVLAVQFRDAEMTVRAQKFTN
jgi:hypothetical protein